MQCVYRQRRSNPHCMGSRHLGRAQSTVASCQAPARSHEPLDQRRRNCRMRRSTPSARSESRHIALQPLISRRRTTQTQDTDACRPHESVEQSCHGQWLNRNREHSTSHHLHTWIPSKCLRRGVPIRIVCTTYLIPLLRCNPPIRGALDDYLEPSTSCRPRQPRSPPRQAPSRPGSVQVQSPRDATE